ncbi:hypothetical protein GCM10027515_03440 [Schumannella luteola]|uniref:Cardiolipin synthase N-terminal domain-containing protein n=1 Tax=Schumannella luteola TaxID=472059 RepID=A0A852YAY6_9MICO|nr:hypothetical protein [Schumannella luteola]NYG98520.1 hypothetical protein [Schumannella luteola]TPX01259.1 hypothetical protein FJ656_28095 [Schumannella luteola]
MIPDPVLWMLLGVALLLIVAVETVTIRDIVRHPRISRDQKTGWIVMVLLVGIVMTPVWFANEERFGRE